MLDLRDITEFFRDFSKYIIAILVMFFIFAFVVAFHPVAGNSMNPTLKEGEIMLVSKFSYLFSKIKRNEIVTVEVDGKSYVKRVIGLPGEKVEYMNGVLYIDGTGYREDFLESDVITHNFLFVDICSEEACPKGVIPDDMYLVLGDNRDESTDSRDPKFGLVTKKQIKGKVFFKIWPLNEIGGVK